MITFDFETKSYADLKKVGCWAYSEDPTTDTICAAYGIGHEPVQTWWPGKKLIGAQAWPSEVAAYTKNKTPTLLQMPYDLLQAIVAGDEIEAHNVAFERSIWQNIMVPKYGWSLPSDKQWRDTMAVAAYYALPMALDRLSRVLGFPGKNSAGNRLITKYSKLYLKTAKTEIPQDDFDKFVEYCVDDVLLEQAVSDELGDLPDRELPIFQLDQKINMRGLHLDLEGIKAASEIVDQRAETLKAEFVAITGFNPTQGAKLKDIWFPSQGLVLDNMQSGYLKEIMEDGQVAPGPTRRALEIRLAINKASTKKLDAMARQCGSGGRALFQTRYHGAGTGRWTGSGFQPLNLVRSFEDVTPEQLVRDIMYGDAEWLDTIYGDAMTAIAKASRHWITAEDGYVIYAGDFVSIEAVILACLAGETWKVDAFRNGVKSYEFMADKIHG